MSIDMNARSVYIDYSDDGTLVVPGRTRLLGLSSAGDTAYGGILNLEFKNGSDSGDVILTVATNHSPRTTVQFMGPAPFLDFPAMGFLFSSGIWLNINWVQSCDTVSGSAEVTKGTYTPVFKDNVREDSIVTGTGIPAGTEVAAVVNNTITLSAAVEAGEGADDVNLTFHNVNAGLLGASLLVMGGG
jgi:hypothetical protein